MMFAGSLFTSRWWSMTCRGQLPDRACLGPGVPESESRASSYLHLPVPLAGDAVRLLGQQHQPASSVLDEGRLHHGVVILWTETLSAWWRGQWARSASRPGVSGRQGEGL